MFKTTIEGIQYYCMTEEEKQHIIDVLNKVESLGDDS